MEITMEKIAELIAAINNFSLAISIAELSVSSKYPAMRDVVAQSAGTPKLDNAIRLAQLADVPKISSALLRARRKWLNGEMAGATNLVGAVLASLVDAKNAAVAAKELAEASRIAAETAQRETQEALAA